MAWTNKMDKDELAKEMFGEDAAAVKAKLAKLDAIEGTVKQTNDTLKSQSELIENLTKTIKEFRVSSPYDNITPPPQKDAPARPDWGEDADAAFADRSAPLVATVLDTKASIAKRMVMENLDKQYHDWHIFSDEIDDISKNAGLNQKIQEEFWKNCYFVAKGKHHDEIVRDQNQKSGKFFLEPAGSSVVIRGNENLKPEESLTDDEKRIANGLGVPLDIYAKNKQTFVGAK